MTTVHRTRSDADFDAWFRSTPVCARNSAGLADEIAREAAVNSAQTKFHTGKYAASWRVIRLPRGEAKVVNTDPKSYLLEVGTGIYGPKRRPIVAKPRTVSFKPHSRTIRLKNGSTKTVQVKGHRRTVAAMVFRPYSQLNAFPTAPTERLGGMVFARSVRGQPGSHAGHRAVVEVVRPRPGVRYLPGRDPIL